jgi:lycopene beta-cyclase
MVAPRIEEDRDRTVIAQTANGSRAGTLVIAGAGLAAAVIARRLSTLANPPQIILLEGSDRPFGEHTWSFHTADVGDAIDWLSPLVAHNWPAQSVRFQGHRRKLDSGYATATSASVADALASLPNVTIRANTPVERLEVDAAVLKSGERISADCVIDTRGFASHPALVLGYQKFVGLEVETSEPHGITEPVIMDATVDQLDGYRFVYLLPFSPTRILIEDTRYSDGEALDQDQLRADILAYAEAQGWTVGNAIHRVEHGVLPISLAYDADAYWADKPQGIPQAGMKAALFHPTTGYSLPEAVRLAEVVAEAWPVGSAALDAKLRAHAKGRAKNQTFYRLLNRMLFRAAEPTRRHLVLERFYRLPRPLIERFYAGQTTFADMARILIGKPPVPIGRALQCLSERAMLKTSRTS